MTICQIWMKIIGVGMLLDHSLKYLNSSKFEEMAIFLRKLMLACTKQSLWKIQRKKKKKGNHFEMAAKKGQRSKYRTLLYLRNLGGQELKIWYSDRVWHQEQDYTKKSETIRCPLPWQLISLPKFQNALIWLNFHGKNDMPSPNLEVSRWLKSCCHGDQVFLPKIQIALIWIKLGFKVNFKMLSPNFEVSFRFEHFCCLGKQFFLPKLQNALIWLKFVLRGENDMVNQNLDFSRLFGDHWHGGFWEPFMILPVIITTCYYYNPPTKLGNLLFLLLF